jgi:hypothetical protein
VRKPTRLHLLPLLLLLCLAMVCSAATGGVTLTRVLCLAPTSDDVGAAGPQAMLAVHNGRTTPLDVRVRVVAPGGPPTLRTLPRVAPLSLLRFTVLTPRDDIRLARAVVSVEELTPLVESATPTFSVRAELVVVCGGAWDAADATHTDGRARPPAHEHAVLRPCGAFRGGCTVLGVGVVALVGAVFGGLVALVVWTGATPKARLA